MSGRSHYEVLGVLPTAEPDEVRQAFRRMARRWHPDRPFGNAGRMQAVNEAWYILSDPRSRAAYDQSLTLPASDTAASAPQKAPGGGRSPGRSGPNSTGQAPSQPLEVVSIRWRWISLAAVVLVGLGVVLVLAVTSASDDPDPVPYASQPAGSSPSEASLPQPEVGDCFLFATPTTGPLITVGCDQPHHGRLVSRQPLGTQHPPDTECHYLRSARELVCYYPPSG